MRLPTAAYFVVGMVFLLVGAFLCVLAGSRPDPAPVISLGVVGALIGAAWLAVGVFQRNRSLPR
jgi:hypothetical protein